ncbi:MAG TPA: TadE/TadG family type IV pilus assembly protein [Xanthobacteraceae bacterium]|jgi:Flp pilus assembly protein TadG|nr:TadE/TadG family type IV pilus assembly protein [Xanthobacteraceae bacterium]
MRRLIRTYRRFTAATQGVAAIEFAMILPILALIFLATFDGGRAIAAYMKMRAATYALASIANQYATIQAADMTSILGATSVVMAPYTSSTPVVTISQIKINSTPTSTIEWSANQGGTARTVGATISPPAAMVVRNSYLILAEVSYTYQPLFGYFNSGSGITFSDSLYVTPRSVSCIVYVPHSSTC